MTDHHDAAAEPGPSSGPDGLRPTSEPQDAAPSPGTGSQEPRAHGGAGARAGTGVGAGPQADAGAHADRSEAGRPNTDRSDAGRSEAGRSDAGRSDAGRSDAGRSTAVGLDDPAGGPGAPHRFRRDRRYKMLSGVCAGLGRQCDMDPVIFRVVLAVLSLTGGLGLLFYGFAWLFVAYDDEEENEVRKLLTGRVDGQGLTAVLFALVGCGVFLTMLSNTTVLTFSVVVSLLLAGAGYWSQHRGTPDPDPLAAQAVADAPPEAQAPPVASAYPSWWRDPIVKDGTHVGGTGYLWGPWEARDRDMAAAVNIARGVRPTRQDIRIARPPKPRGPRWIGGWIFLLALVAGGIGTSATWDDRTLAASLQTGLACALTVFGLGIAFSAFLGRTGAGSIFLAVVTAGLLACTAALPSNITTDWARTKWTPQNAESVAARYELGTGVGTLDLSGVDIPKGKSLTTSVEVGAGKVKVVVPRDVTVRLDIEVGLGDIQLPGDDKEDVDVAPDKRDQLTLAPEKGAGSGGTLTIDLEVGLGQAEVARAAA
ncbi:PspC domain-containing protein [Streptomyces sp. ID01-12c]|uniref:PspC domain-containing protein n=1 Tax=Streptomyces caniscabiei TaxID=2746961 RepID=UPI00178639E6|nr:PspC domain-containing protein [Streptomyces caniscabiei]MBD9701801.1 PspC domain-containing protein [Streptomyces caniscabiei]MDX3728626.1 PspC domain-containing protein [Streptomyces caniscabiei]